MAAVYILYSQKLDRYYYGSCNDLSVRIELHFNKTFADSFTAKANDWILYFSIENLEISHARAIETHLKKMKSRKYIQNLIRYPEMQQKLKEQFKNLQLVDKHPR